MQSFRVTLSPLTAFATPLKGDTLFGQLCWAIRNRFGEARLEQCLQNYTAKQPFAVLSDAMPKQYLPLPKLPSRYYQKLADCDAKAIKKRNWLDETAIASPVVEWLAQAKTTAQVAENYAYLTEKHPQPHNTIHRQSNTTGETGFAPYSVEQEWFIPGLEWSVYILLDSERLSQQECQQCLTDIGNIGFGKDASIGLGKFAVVDFQPHVLPSQVNANACLTLAPCAPQQLGFDPQQSFYQCFTRFGRHGDIAVHQQAKPFKNPVLLAQTAAVFTTPIPETGFIGQGIGGNGLLSKTLAATVQQGYAPIIAIKLVSEVVQ